MYSQRATRALMCTAASVKRTVSQQVRHKSHTTSSHVNARSLSLASNAWQHQVELKEQPVAGNVLSWASAENGFLRVEFGDGTYSNMPYAWLRNRCKCSKCSRLGNLDSYTEEGETEVYPEIIQRYNSRVVIDWSDGHISKYTVDWLRSAIFIPPYENVHAYAEAT